MEVPEEDGTMLTPARRVFINPRNIMAGHERIRDPKRSTGAVGNVMYTWGVADIPDTPRRELEMPNPWTKKNPFLSIWLSGANALAGKARSAGKAEAGRQQAGMIKQATRFWTGAWLAAIKPKRRR